MVWLNSLDGGVAIFHVQTLLALIGETATKADLGFVTFVMFVTFVH